MIETAEAYGLQFLFPAGDTAVGAALRDHGEFARPEVDFLVDHATGDAGCFVDVGANIGAISLPFAKARPSWRVMAFEAFSGAAQLLGRSALANALGNVSVFAAAIGDRTGAVDFPDLKLSGAGNFGAMGLLSEMTQRVPVRMFQLDDIASVDTKILKVDVEGFEPSVFRGATRLLQEAKPIILFESHAEDAPAAQQIVAKLSSLGYGLFWFFSPFVTPDCARGSPLSPGRGDMSIAALPPSVSNRWGLTPVADITRRPTSHEAFPYLSRYGYASKK